MKAKRFYPLTEAQKDIVRTMSGKYNLTKICMAADSSMHFVKQVFAEENLTAFKLPKKGKHYIPKRTRGFSKAYIPDAPKTFVRHKPDHTNTDYSTKYLD